LGIVVEDISRKQQATAGSEASTGVRVAEVEAGSLAEQYLLQPGDIIQSVDLKPVASTKQFNEALKKTDPANGIMLHFVSRGARRFEILMDRK
jgi:S1-C subfamily serine protease